MKLNKNFYDEFNKLIEYQDSPLWADFFSSIKDLERLAEDIDDEMHKDKSDTSFLDKKARKITSKLESQKLEIAQRTVLPDKYDAVYRCIDLLVNHFNYTE